MVCRLARWGSPCRGPGPLHASFPGVPAPHDEPAHGEACSGSASASLRRAHTAPGEPAAVSLGRACSRRAPPPAPPYLALPLFAGLQPHRAAAQRPARLERVVRHAPPARTLASPCVRRQKLAGAHFKRISPRHRASPERRARSDRAPAPAPPRHRHPHRDLRLRERQPPGAFFPARANLSSPALLSRALILRWERRESEGGFPPSPRRNDCPGEGAGGEVRGGLGRRGYPPKASGGATIWAEFGWRGLGLCSTCLRERLSSLPSPSR